MPNFKRGEKEINGLKRIFNLKPSRATHLDYRAQRIPSFPENIKESYSWLYDGFEVYDQLDTGTCTGNAASAVIKCQTNGRICPSRMSLWMSGVWNDEWEETIPGCLGDGTSLKAVLDYAKKYGFCTEAEWPFNGYYKEDGYAFLKKSLKIDSYYNLGKDHDLWKKWICNFGPIYMAVQIDSSYVNPNPNGTLNKYNPNDVYGGHAIFCAGYKEDGKWILPGSWGKSYGLNGIVYPDDEWMNNIEEAYGIIL